MNRIKIALFAVLTCCTLNQTVFADDSLELTAVDLPSHTQDYIIELAERPQPRRSELVAALLNKMLANAELAKAEVDAEKITDSVISEVALF